MIFFTIYGDPVAQGRARFSTRNGKSYAYDPPKSKAYKKLVSLTAIQYMTERNLAPISGPVYATINVYVPIPKSWSKAKRTQALSGALQPISKPDLSNYVKGIEDGLEGICYNNDSQIVRMASSKDYSNNPRVEVELYRYDQTG